MRRLDSPRPILSPGVCVVCGLSPDGEWVDTLFDTDAGPAHELNGRKYLCGSCVETAAGVLGLQRVDVILVELELQNSELADNLDRLRDSIRALAEEV